MTETSRPAPASGAPRAAPAPVAANHIAMGKSERLALVGIVALALAVRAYYTTYAARRLGRRAILPLAGPEPVVWTGYSIFGYSGAHFPPLFPVLAGGLAPLVGGLQAASNLLYVICGGLLVLPLYALAGWIYSRPAALATGLVTAVYPALTTGVLAWGTMTEPLSLLLTAVAVCALYLALEHGKWGSFAALGVTLGLCYLTRTDASCLCGRCCSHSWQPDAWCGGAGRGGGAENGVDAPAVFPRFRPLSAVHACGDRPWGLTGAAGMAYVSMEGLAIGTRGTFDAATWGLDPASGEVYLFAQASEDEGLSAAVVRNPLAFLRRVRASLADLPALLFSVTLVGWPLGVLAALAFFDLGIGGACVANWRS